MIYVIEEFKDLQVNNMIQIDTLEVPEQIPHFNFEIIVNIILRKYKLCMIRQINHADSLTNLLLECFVSCPTRQSKIFRKAQCRL